MINNILALIFLGVTISLAISNGFNINKMERAARKLAFQAISDARKTPLPSLKGITISVGISHAVHMNVIKDIWLEIKVCLQY